RRLVSAGVKVIAPLGNGRLRNMEHFLTADAAETMRYYHVSKWIWPADLVPEVIEHATAFTDPNLWTDELNDVERMMYIDLVTYLPEDILTKLDRASMAVSLEAREPLLDYRLVEFAWRLPLTFKIYQGQAKRILRSVLARYIPPHLFERPKMGF